MSRLLVGLALLVLLMGASTTAAPVPTHLVPKEKPLYFPRQVGAKWVYDTGVKTVFGDLEVTESITAIEETDTGAIVTVKNHESKEEGKVRVTRTGLESYGGESASPHRLLKVPCAVGEKWDCDCSTENYVQKYEYTTLGTEEVKVPAGKFIAVRVHVKITSGPNDGKPFSLRTTSFDNWYAPGVGLVKVQDGFLSLRLVLKSFTP